VRAVDGVSLSSAVRSRAIGVAATGAIAVFGAVAIQGAHFDLLKPRSSRYLGIWEAGVTPAVVLQD